MALIGIRCLVVVVVTHPLLEAFVGANIQASSDTLVQEVAAKACVESRQ